MAKPIGFPARFEVRLRKEEVALIHEAVQENQDLFHSASHFGRCAILRELRRLGYKQRPVINIEKESDNDLRQA